MPRPALAVSSAHIAAATWAASSSPMKLPIPEGLM
jgi:hypothetical protein